MSEFIKKSDTFVGYDYKEVIASQDNISFLMDSYENFGWIRDDNIIYHGPDKKGVPVTKIILPLKRDRKIMNKTELTRLQRHFESCMKELDYLEKSKTSKATMLALIVGILGTVFMAGAVFAITSDPPQIALCIILSLPAILGWISPYFIYRQVAKQRSQTLEPFVDKKREEIYEICEKANKLLHI